MLLLDQPSAHPNVDHDLQRDAAFGVRVSGDRVPGVGHPLYSFEEGP